MVFHCSTVPHVVVLHHLRTRHRNISFHTVGKLPPPSGHTVSSSHTVPSYLTFVWLPCRLSHLPTPISPVPISQSNFCLIPDQDLPLNLPVTGQDTAAGTDEVYSTIHPRVRKKDSACCTPPGFAQRPDAQCPFTR